MKPGPTTFTPSVLLGQRQWIGSLLPELGQGLGQWWQAGMRTGKAVGLGAWRCGLALGLGVWGLAGMAPGVMAAELVPLEVTPLTMARSISPGDVPFAGDDPVSRDPFAIRDPLSPGDALASREALISRDMVTLDDSLPSLASGADLLQQGVIRYQSGNFAQAAQLWQRAAEQFATDPLATDPLNHATALIHLSLALRQLGQWDAAQTALNQSFTLLQDAVTGNDQKFALAKAFNAQGSLDLVQGHLGPALASFQQAVLLYDQLGDRYGQFQSQMNQAKVFQAQGRNTLAKRQLESLATAIEGSPDSPLKAATLRQLGEVLQLTSSLDEGAVWLEQSLAVAEAIGSETEQSATLLSLGLLAKNRQDFSKALEYYQLAATTTPSPSVRLQALTNAFELLLEPGQEPSRQGDTAGEGTVPASFTLMAVQQAIEQTLDQVPPNRTTLFAQIHYAQILLRAPIELATPGQIAQRLAKVVQEARTVADPQSESYALGRLGQVYERAERWTEAKTVTEEALAIADQANVPEIAYQWQWQLGRILKVQGQLEQAERAYQTAIDILQDLRGDLASLNPEARFSFREEIEPIYRQYVSLLLTPRSQTQVVGRSGVPSADWQLDRVISPSHALAKTLDRTLKTLKPGSSAEPDSFFSPEILLSSGLSVVDNDRRFNQDFSQDFSQTLPDQGQVSQDKLDQARQVIESLQVAELVNFFQADCVTVSAIDADEIDPTAGVVYTILLDDRLEILMSQPGYPIVHHSVEVAATRVEFIARRLQNQLRRQEGGFQGASRILYDWLIEPLEEDLDQREVETLVFVLDGALRNIPMSVLFDGEQYLVEKYALGLTPGLQLFDPKPLQGQELTAFIGALSEARQEFSALPAVPKEVETIGGLLPSNVLINDQFQEAAVAKEITEAPTPIVHFATHGQFSSNVEDTFILTWDGKINIEEFSELLQGGFIGDDQAIELLVFSACETAAGDSRAALGLAGLAVRAGARSTLATLWQVDDQGTSQLMGQFYANLATGEMTKAEAIRQAQLSLLQTTQFTHPFYWSPFVLVGNWL
ncbi:MAG: CHAT domain-containing protein [Prochlorothrix sp.]|nr:CHAT domain-containing protein [Prochlorothrix sp.]